MAKVSNQFQFNYPLKNKVVKDLRIVTEHVGDLIIEAVGYEDQSASRFDVFDRYSVDVESIKWNGCDIKAVLEITGGIDEIIESAIREFARQTEGRVAA